MGEVEEVKLRTTRSSIYEWRLRAGVKIREVLFTSALYFYRGLVVAKVDKMQLREVLNCVKSVRA